MRAARVYSLKNQRVIAEKCSVAERFMDRFMGLMGREGLEPGCAMYFPKCNSIHMWFMRFPIDVIFLRSETHVSGKETWKISGLHSEVKPWKVLPLTHWSSTEVLELPAGTITRCQLEVGDEICIS